MIIYWELNEEWRRQKVLVGVITWLASVKLSRSLKVNGY